LEFGRYSNRIADLTPQHQDLPSGHHPFPTRFARRNSSLTFNIAAYSRQLVTDFLIEGGKIEITEFHAPSELSRIPQKTIVNATGYGARALWNDQSVVPVRGQIAWLIPEPEATYGVWYKGVQILARRDGIVVQQLAGGDMFGYNDASETPDRAEAEAAVETAAELFRRMSETATPTAASASAP
jgi:glycine/D-amino acid oxidase-like deaminating enzyme